MTGILCINKPAGQTSFATVRQLRCITGEKKIGHTGTLDPMATGVLPMMLGGATRFLDFLPTHNKAYRAQIQLGMTTDTLDHTGTILDKKPYPKEEGQFQAVLQEFVGEITQLPPMYSAVSQDGVRLYQLARQGITVERAARQVTVYQAVLLAQDVQAGQYTVEVVCSAGTYIRSLAADIGEKLGCGAILTALERTAANGFTLAHSRTLEQLEALTAQGQLQAVLLSVEQALMEYPCLAVSEAQAKRFQNGGALDKVRLHGLTQAERWRVYDPNGRFLGLGRLGTDCLEILRIYQER